MKEFDEEDALKYVRNHIGPFMSEKVANDNVIYEVIDLSFDFFDTLDDDDPFEVTIDDTDHIAADEHFDRLTDFIAKGLIKSGHNIPRDIVAAMTEGELLYESTLD